MNQMFAPSPWTPQAVQALSQQEFMNKRMKANSPADDWKQGMWQHVPGKGFGGGPEESFSWDQPAFHLSPEAMQWHLQRSQQANPMPMTVPSAPLPSVNAFNPNGSYNPNAPVMGRSPFSGGAWPQATQPLTGYSGGQAPSFAQMFPMTLPQESYPFGSF